MEKAVDQLHDPHLVGFCSFTRAACDEAADRAADRFGMKRSELREAGWFKTIHGIAYRCLGVGKELLTDAKESREWLRNAMQDKADAAPLDPDDETLDVFDGTQTDAQRALALWGVSRNRLEPLQEAWARADECDTRTPPYHDCVRLIEQYEQAKRLDGRVDFVDIVGRFAGWRFHPDGPDKCEPDGEVPRLACWIQDEAQDSTRLLDSAFRRLIEPEEVRWVYLGADPFQCQPRGTPVLTSKGYKPIEQLTEDDNLIACSLKDGRFYGTSKHIPFQRASRIVDSSSVYEITLEDGTVHYATENHKWYCRLNPGTQFATYLMRQRERWRIGTVQMFASETSQYRIKNGSWRLNARCNQESAEAAWILSVFPSNREARAYEQIASYRFGIPQVTFRPPSGQTHLDSWFIDTVFASLGDLSPHGERCLKEHGLLLEQPYWTYQGRHKNGQNYGRKIPSCNLLPGVSMLPKRNLDAWSDGRRGKKNGVIRTKDMEKRRTLRERVTWVGVTSVRRLPPGTPTEVFSLNVEKFHTYITKEFVTCNSIFGWAGSDHRCFTNGYPIAKQRIMPKSHRCSDAILRLGEDVLRNCSDYWDRGIEPAGPGGEIDEMAWQDDWASEIDPSQSWLLLARTNVQAARIAKQLNSQSIPWWPTKKNMGSPWKAPVRATMVGAFRSLAGGAWIDGKEWKTIVEHIPQKLAGEELLRYGVKSEIAMMETSVAAERWPWLQPDGLMDAGATQKLLDLIASGGWVNLVDGADDYIAAIERWGWETVQEPKVRLGTVHSAKGFEADSVLLLTTISAPCYQTTQTEEGADEERRVEYVAVTRSKRRLIVVNEHRAKFRWGLPI